MVAGVGSRDQPIPCGRVLGRQPHGVAVAQVPIPSWQRQILTTLAGKGQLSGVNPTDLAAIDVAESSGQGGAINSAGYGGFFGLGSASTYPTGTTTPAMLKTGGAAGFAAQAPIAAGEYASLLKQVGGTTLAAETAYQQGLGGLKAHGIQGEGVNVFRRYGLGGTTTSASPSAGASSTTGTSAITTGFTWYEPWTWQSGITSDLEEWAVRGILIVFGAILIVLGLKALADQGEREIGIEAPQGVGEDHPGEAGEDHAGEAGEAAEAAAA